MYKSKLITVLSTFDSRDWKRFNRFYLGHTEGRKETKVLFDYISKYKGQFSSKKIDIDVVHPTLFPNISRKSFQNIMSKLMIICEDYIRWHWLQQDRTAYDMALLKAYRKRGLYHFYNLKARKVHSRLDSSREISLWDELTYLQLYHDQFFSDNPIKAKDGHSVMRLLVSNLVNFTTSISTFYQAIILHFSRITNQDMDEEIKWLEPFQIRGYPSIKSKTLEHLMLLNKLRVPQSFHFLYEQLLIKNTQYSAELQAAILLSLLAYAHRELNLGNSISVEELLNLYVFGIHSGALLVDNQISTTRFVNIVNTSSASGAYTWTQEFIDAHQQLLHPEIRLETISIAKAQLRFYEGDYESVIDLLNDQTMHEFNHILRSRWLTLCSLFMIQRKDIVFMDSIFKNYNSFFYNNKGKISKSNYNGSLKLSGMLKKIIHAISLQQVVVSEKELEGVVFRAWLMALLEKLGVTPGAE